MYIHQAPTLPSSAAGAVSGGENMNKDICVRCGEGVVNIRVGAIIIKDNKVLMVNNNRDDYYYSVGGRIQFGETAEQAIKREVKRRTGL